MDKLIYLLWGPEGQDKQQRRDILLNEVAPKLLAVGARKLTMYIDDPDSNVRSPAPFHIGERICGEVALWLDDAGKRAPFEQVLRDAGFRVAGYLVDESIYTEYGGNRHSGPRDWPDGQRSPGVVTITLMERPQKLSREEWIRRWHGRQSPVSEAMQPRTRYIRNVVMEAVTPDAPPFEGIVEEAWPSARHVTNPFLFYGAGKNPFKLVLNLVRMLRSVTSFLDLRRIRTTTASEYILKS
ncbi:MAG: hypothetical protein DRI40_08835 [Chloroflexi bacterium]|nr:MAG: hypothetical protein DRI40_08835 [Chloroflexota bacterium]